MKGGRKQVPCPASAMAGVVMALVTALVLAACHHVMPPSTHRVPAKVARGEAPLIEIGDVHRFYSLYDAVGGRPTAEQLQAYIDTGSSGLRAFAEMRRTTGVRIAEAMARSPETYADARRCLQPLPRVQARVADALSTLRGLYPDARLPPVTIAVGRGKPVAIGSQVTGIQVGLEALCATEYLNADVEDRFVHVIVHEYVHVQQAWPLADLDHMTVLETSLLEGVAEFVAELTSGSVAYAHLPGLVAGREAEIEAAFLGDRSNRDLSAWVGSGTSTQPGELGYWVGYRIAKSYYHRAKDKPRALREMLEMRDAETFLAQSGWHPGMTF